MRAPHTELRALHNGSGVLGEALAALLGYSDASAALATATARCGEYLRTVPVSNDAAAVALVLGLLEAGEPLPASLPSDVWQTVHGREAVAALEGTFQQVLQHLSGRRDQVIESGRDAILEHLDGTVRACVDEARTLDLAGSRTADEALDAGVGEAWRRMRELRSRYADIRSAQTTVFRILASSGGQSPLGTLGFLRNLDELVPDWADIQRGRVTVFADGQMQETGGGGRYPWLRPVTDMLEDDVEDDDDLRFTWLVATPAAVPWVPTPAQLEEARKAAEEALRASAPKPDAEALRRQRRADRDMRSMRELHQAQQPLRDRENASSFGEPW